MQIHVFDDMHELQHTKQVYSATTTAEQCDAAGYCITTIRKEHLEPSILDFCTSSCFVVTLTCADKQKEVPAYSKKYKKAMLAFLCAFKCSCFLGRNGPNTVTGSRKSRRKTHCF